MRLLTWLRRRAVRGTQAAVNTLQDAAVQQGDTGCCVTVSGLPRRVPGLALAQLTSGRQTAVCGVCATEHHLGPVGGGRC